MHRPSRVCVREVSAGLAEAQPRRPLFQPRFIKTCGYGVSKRTKNSTFFPIEPDFIVLPLTARQPGIQRCP